MRYLTLLTLLLLCLGCGPYSENQLLGEWKGLELTEEGDSVAVDPSLVRFTFRENGRYEFNSTLDYNEAGSYRLQDTYLFTRDTTRSGSEEKAVEVRRLTPDTLIIRMMDNERERILVLGR